MFLYSKIFSCHRFPVWVCFTLWFVSDVYRAPLETKYLKSVLQMIINPYWPTQHHFTQNCHFSHFIRRWIKKILSSFFVMLYHETGYAVTYVAEQLSRIQQHLSLNSLWFVTNCPCSHCSSFSVWLERNSPLPPHVSWILKHASVPFITYLLFSTIKEMEILLQGSFLLTLLQPDLNWL